MRIVFMGTPEFAVPCLQKLIDCGHEVTGVFTQPDKPQGRKMILTPPPVKELAIANGIPVYQPVKMRDGTALEMLKEANPELAIVVAYGKILPKEILEFPKYGCINIHASLLPKLRGAGPIQWSVINGFEKTGVTSMQMDEGLDTGDMLISREIEIGENDTAGDMHDKLSVIGAEVLEEMEDSEEYEALDASYFFGEAADSVCVNPIMYPDRKTIERCAMMHDTDTEALLKMWARVKGANASAWTYILIVLVLGGLIFSVVLKYYRQNSRKKRYRKPKRKS